MKAGPSPSVTTTHALLAGQVQRKVEEADVVAVGWQLRLAVLKDAKLDVARRHVVQVSRSLTAGDVAGATIHVYPLPYGREARTKPPFPSDPHYDAKAWEQCTARKSQGRVLFWNVAGPAEP